MLERQVAGIRPVHDILAPPFLWGLKTPNSEQAPLVDNASGGCALHTVVTIMHLIWLRGRPRLTRPAHYRVPRGGQDDPYSPLT